MLQRGVLRARLRRLAFTGVAVLGALLLLEGAARLGIVVGLHLLLPPDVRAWVANNHVSFDPELGWRPSGTGPIEGGNFKGESFVDDARPRTPGELRGYAFGDSQTHGAGLAEHNAWPSVAERRLREAGHNVRIINLGSSGYRSAQVLRLLETYALPRRPDFLLVDCQVNDSAPLPRDYGLRWAPVRRVLFESRLFRLLALGVAKARGENTGPTGSVVIRQSPTDTNGAGNHDTILELAKAEKVPLLFVDYPFMGHPIAQLAPPARLPEGAEVVLASEALRTSGQTPEALFLEANHLSVAGSEVVGAAVAERLAETLGL